MDSRGTNIILICREIFLTGWVIILFLIRLFNYAEHLFAPVCKICFKGVFPIMLMSEILIGLFLIEKKLDTFFVGPMLGLKQKIGILFCIYV